MKGKNPKRKRPCPTLTPDQIDRGYYCKDGKISKDKKKFREYNLRKRGGTRRYVGPLEGQTSR